MSNSGPTSWLHERDARVLLNLMASSGSDARYFSMSALLCHSKFISTLVSFYVDSKCLPISNHSIPLSSSGWPRERSAGDVCPGWGKGMQIPCIKAQVRITDQALEFHPGKDDIWSLCTSLFQT